METLDKYTPNKLAETLLGFLKLSSNEKKSHRFLREIAYEIIKKTSVGKDPYISTKEIFYKLFSGNDESQASSLLANIWKSLPKLHDEIRTRLIEYAVNNCEMDVYPWIEKQDSDGGAGNLVKYRLVGIKIDIAKVIGPNIYRNKIQHDIEYVAVQDFKPTFVGKLLFGHSNEIIGAKKWIMVFTPFFQMIFYVVMIFSLFLLLKDKTLSSISFYYIALLVGAVWFLIDKINRFNRFTEDRIILASDYFMSWDETSILQEMVTVKDDRGNDLYKKVQLTKYVGVCPICSSQVELAKGEPDYPRRIIGRCKESTREHIFSFDQITKLGKNIGFLKN